MGFITAIIIAVAAITAAVVGIIQVANPPKPGKISFGFGGGVEGSPRYGLFGPLDNTVSNELAIPVLYGQLKLAGNVVWQTDPGVTVARIVALCEGEVNDISDVRANDVVINAANTPESSFTAYKGTNAQEADSRVTAAVRPDMALKRLAYLSLTLTASDKLKGGNPTITSVCQGLLVETFTNGTWGTAKSYSRNPAACVRDFILNSRYGLGLSKSLLDDAAFGGVYDHCQELVDGPSGKEVRYRLDYIMDTQRPAQDALNDMLATFNGFLVYAGNLVKLKVEKSESSVIQFFGDGSTTKANAQFDPNNIVADSFQWNLSSIDDRPNRIRLQWVDPDQNYVKVYTQVEDRIDQDGRNTVITKDISLLGITRQSQASRMAKLHMSMAKYASASVRFAARLESIHCEIGDVVAVTHQAARFTRKLFRITGMQEGEDETIWFTCREYNASIYDDHQATAIVTYDQPSGPNLYASLSDVTGITLVEDNFKNKDGVFVTNILASWTAIPADELLRLDRHKLQLSSDGGATYRDVAFASRDRISYRIVLGNVQTGTTFVVRVRTVSDRGAESAGATAQITIQGKSTPPSDVKDFDVTFAGDHVAMSWSAVNDEDLFGYEIRVGDSDAIWESSALVITEVLGTRYDLFGFTTGAKKYFIKAIDNSQNYSETAATDSINITAIPDSNVVVQNDLWGRITQIEHPLFGLLSSELSTVPTTDFDPAYYRPALEPRTNRTWNEIRDNGYNDDGGKTYANLQSSPFRFGREVFVTSEQSYTAGYSDCSSDSKFSNNAVLMLKMDGADGSTTFTDSSVAARAMTAQGSAEIDTAQFKFGGAAGRFNGGGYVTTPSTADFDIGTGDFTVDCWIRIDVADAAQNVCTRLSGNTGFHVQIYQFQSVEVVLGSGDTDVYRFPFSFALDTWYHLAVTRASGNLRCFVDGTQRGTTQEATANATRNTNFVIGANDTGAAGTRFRGWIDEFRFIRGAAVWTSNFTVPAAAYTLCTTNVRAKTIDLGAKYTGTFVLDIRTFSSTNLGFVSLEIAVSDDNVSFSAYKPFTPGQYSGRYVSFRFLIQAINSTTKVRLVGAKLTIDLPTKTQDFLNQSIGAGGSTIYLTGFNTVRSIVMTTVGTNNYTPRIHDQGSLPSSFDIRLFDTAGALQSGNVNVQIRGF